MQGVLKSSKGFIMKMTNIYLLGVFHTFQTQPSHTFTEYVCQTCAALRIKSLAEEMNHDALRDACTSHSTVKPIADKLSIPHAYCDPDQNERQARGIRGENDLKFQRWLNEWSDDEFVHRKALHCQKREEVWIEKLQDVFIKPMLFICGIDHLDTFGSLLNHRGFSSKQLEKRWTPNQPLQPTKLDRRNEVSR